MTMSSDDELLSLEEIEEIAGHGFCPKHRNVRYCPDMCNEPQVLSPDRLIATAKAAHALRESEALAYAVVEEQRVHIRRLEPVVEAAREWAKAQILFSEPEKVAEPFRETVKRLSHAQELTAEALIQALRTLDTNRREE